MLFIFAAAVSAQTLGKIEEELSTHFEKLEQASNYGGTRNSAVQSRENRRLRTALIRYGARADVLAYAFPRLKEKLCITTSKDGRLRAYSWDARWGGTMHDFLTVYQYRGKSGRVHTWSAPYSEDIGTRGVGTFVHDIFQTMSASGPIYLAVSSFIGSTSLSGQFISAFRINGENVNDSAKVIRTAKGLTDSILFEYNFFSVVDHPERPIKLVFFDETKKSFRFPVVVNDAEMPDGRVTDKYITYRFNGKYFVKVS